MILHSADLSPDQNAAHDEGLTPGLQEMESTNPCAQILKIVNPEERRAAAEQMRYQLYLLDRSQHRMSIEDCMAALLEASGSEASA